MVKSWRLHYLENMFVGIVKILEMPDVLEKNMSELMIWNVH